MTGHREYNTGWHTAQDLANLLIVSEAITRSALERRESRGGHFRQDYPGKDKAFADFNVVVRQGPDGAMHGIEHDHAFADFRRVVAEGALLPIAAPDSKRRLSHVVSSYEFSLTICSNSGGIGGSGTCATCIAPSGPWRTTTLKSANAWSFPG